MESKKTKKSNLENKRVLFMEIGLLIALSVALVAFEWSSSKTDSYIAQNSIDIGDMEEDMINTFRKEPPKKVIPPKIEPIVLQIVENTVEIKDELPDFSSETTQSEIIDFVSFEPTEEAVEEQPFFKVEDMPKFRGGDLINFVKYVNQNLKYPAIAAENGIEGRVFIQFVVSKFGDVKNVTLVRGADPALDKEALRVVSASPKWEPGKQRGTPVNVCFTVPINFQLQK